MAKEVYHRLCEVLAKRGGRYPGKDIPEFYALAEELFTEAEAGIYVAIPKGFHTAGAVAETLGKGAGEVSALLEQMADKGVVTAGRMGEETYYSAPVFVPGIFEFQFMRGTKTDQDRKLARLIHAYKAAVDAARERPAFTFPTTRVIPVDRTIEAGSTIHTYHQVASYIEKYHPLSVSTCFCRHEAKLLDPEDDCHMPDEVCMQFGMGAQFIIDRKMGREISKEEAMAILQTAEEAGLVHASVNRQDIDFLCNCCKCHCMILQTAFDYDKPGIVLNSGFQPVHDADLCTACGVCIDRCPAEALTMGADDVPVLNPDRCIGCGACATGCDFDAVTLTVRADIQPPPVNQKALIEAVKASAAK